MNSRNKRSAGKNVVLLLGLVLLLTACKDSPSPAENSGLTPLETIKNYEHTVRRETAADKSQGVEDGTPSAAPVPDNINPVRPTGMAPEDGYEETNDTVYVIATKVNLRSGPSTDTDVISQAVYGDSFTRLAKGSNGWDKLLYNDQIVYAFAEYLSTEDTAGRGAGTDMGTLAADLKKN